MNQKKAPSLWAEDLSTKKDSTLSFKHKIINSGAISGLKTRRPLDIGQLSPAQFNTELEKGYKQIEAGKGIPADIAFSHFRERFGFEGRDTIPYGGNQKEA